MQRLLGTGGNQRIVAAFVKRVLDSATRRDGNGGVSKVQASIGQYVVRQHAGALGGRYKGEASVTGKESSEYTPHSSTAQHIQSAPTRNAHIKDKVGSDDNLSKDKEQKQSGSEGDGAARPTASLRKLRSQDQVESPVAARYVLAVTRTRVPMEYEGCDNEAAQEIQGGQGV